MHTEAVLISWTPSFAKKKARGRKEEKELGFVPTTFQLVDFLCNRSARLLAI